MARIDDELAVSGQGQDYVLSAAQVIDVLTTTERAVQRATYPATSDPTSVYYTAYLSDATTILQARAKILNPPLLKRAGFALYYFDQLLPDGLTDFIAVWDEGTVGTYSASWVTVDTRAGGQPGSAVPEPGGPPTQSVPGTPTNVVAVGGDTQATVSWTAPASGDSPITNYIVLATDSTTAANGGQVSQPPATSTVMIGLTNGDSYTFTVAASNIFGTSLFSAASNAVTPAQVAQPPGAPTNPSAAGGDTQAVVSFSPPNSNGGASIAAYKVTPHDETAGTTGGTTSGASSPITVTGLTNNHTYYFTVVAHNSAGDGPQSVATGTVVPNPTAGGAGVATFGVVPGVGSSVTLDGTGSVGTLTWNVDGHDSFVHTTQLLIGPLTIGSHHFKLTAVGTTTAVSEGDFDVAWIAKPIASANHDPCNGGNGSVPTPGQWNNNGDITASTVPLPQWSSLPVLGPWRNKNVLNTAESVPPGDGIPRIVAVSNAECSLLTKYGDWPQKSGGFRSAMEINRTYTDSTVPFTTPFFTRSFDPCGSIPTDSSGNPSAQSGSVRFYRIEVMFPDTNPGGANAPSGYGTGQPWLYQNNACEIHSIQGTNTSVKFSLDGAGQNWEWVMSPLVAGSGKLYKFDTHKTLYNTWYSYVVEYLLSLDPAVGYFRLWRDTGTGMQPVITGVPSGTILSGSDAGKFIFANTSAPTSFTQQVDNTGKPLVQFFDIQNYRTRTGTPATYPDVVIHYRNLAIGSTLASVLV